MLKKSIAVILALCLGVCCFSACKKKDSGYGTTALTAADESGFKAVMTPGEHWQSDGLYCTRYTVTVTNSSDKLLSDWEVHFELPEGGSITEYSRCSLTQSTNTVFVKADFFNCALQVGEILNNVTLAVAIPENTAISGFSAECNYDDGTLGTSSGSGLYVDGVIAGGYYEASAPSVQESSAENASSAVSVPDNNASGRLKVSGTKLTDSTGKTVQLRGISTDYTTLQSPVLTEKAFRSIKDGFGANAIRIVIDASNYSDSCVTVADSAADIASMMGLYVIIDFHISADPTPFESEAIDFFTRLCERCTRRTNVIYEICGGSGSAAYKSAINPYAKNVVSAIRAVDSSSLILIDVGKILDVCGSPVSDANTMYSLTVTSQTPADSLSSDILTALSAGVPVFIGQFGISAADTSSADTWLNFLDSNTISFMAWNLDKLITGSPESISDSTLTSAGTWFKKAVSGK